MKVTVKEKVLQIKFSYSPDLVQKVRTLDFRGLQDYKKFEKLERAWYCPNIQVNIDKLREWGFTIHSNYLATEIISSFETVTGRSSSDTPNFTEDPKSEKPKKKIKLPKHLAKILFPYQKEGVQFIENKDGRCLIGDDMGLGKTIQALAYLEMHPEIRPAIIACPSSLKLNWIKECKLWMSDFNIFLLTGKKPGSLAKKYRKQTLEKFQVVKSDTDQGPIFIINYDILSSWAPELIKLNPSILICDESHFFKNPKAKRTKAVKKIAKKCKHFLALSGTPITNKPVEFFNALNLIDPDNFPSYWGYAHRYCGAKHNGYGWDFKGATNTDELFNLVQGIMIRRKKSEVLKELPEKIRTVIPIELTNQSQYNYAGNDFIKYLKRKKGEGAAKKAEAAETLVRIEGLKQLAVAGKMKGILKWIEEYLESNDKLVVFAVHIKVLDTLEKAFGSICVRVDGSVTGKNRDQAVENFQKDPSKRLFLGNKAAGVGLTLTAASATCTIELPWSPGECDQQEDRVHRIGQEADSVHAYYLLAQGSIEDEIMELLDKKRKVIAAVLDGEEVQDTSLLSELIKKYKGV